MRPSTFYRGALLLPIIVPLVLWAFAERIAMSNVDAEVTAFFLYSLPAAGVPYLLCAGGLAWWMRDKKPLTIRRTSLRAPILFVPCAWVGMLAEVAITQDLVGTGGVGGFVLIGVSVLLVGYTYVGLVEAARWLGERAGLFSEPQVA